MGDQWTMGKGIYEADTLDTYVVGLRLEQIAAGGFVQVSNTTPITLPRNMKMRYVLGTDTFTGATQKLYVASQTDPLWITSSPPALFYYGAPGFENTFTVGARIGQKYPGRF